MNYCLVVVNKNNFIYPYIKDFEVYNLYKYVFNDKVINKLYKLLCSILLIFGQNKYVFDDWYRQLEKEGTNVVFLDECGISRKVVKIINKYSDRCAVYCWNPSEKISYFENFKLIKANIFSFDKEDCRKYNFSFYNSIIPNYNILKKNDDVEFDLFFLGMDKGRKTILENIKKSCNPLTCNFIVLNENSIGNINPISYDEYISLLCKSRAVVEILQEGQSGETMRTVESIQLKKKLITNNVSIRNAPYYSPSNIFIIDYLHLPDFNTLHAFLSSPFDESVVEYLKGRYPKEWVKNLFVDTY